MLTGLNFGSLRNLSALSSYLFRGNCMKRRPEEDYELYKERRRFMNKLIKSYLKNDSGEKRA